MEPQHAPFSSPKRKRAQDRTKKKVSGDVAIALGPCSFTPALSTDACTQHDDENDEPPVEIRKQGEAKFSSDSQFDFGGPVGTNHESNICAIKYASTPWKQNSHVQPNIFGSNNDGLSESKSPHPYSRRPQFSFTAKTSPHNNTGLTPKRQYSPHLFTSKPQTSMTPYTNRSSATPFKPIAQKPCLLFPVPDRKQTHDLGKGLSNNPGSQHFPSLRDGSWSSDDTHASPSSTPFRFSSFPASLPRVHPRATKTSVAARYALSPRYSQLHSGVINPNNSSLPTRITDGVMPSLNAPMSVRKRRSPSSNTKFIACYGVPPFELDSPDLLDRPLSPILSKMADVSHDTSISSISSASPPVSFRNRDDTFTKRRSLSAWSPPIEVDVKDDCDEENENESGCDECEKVSGIKLNFTSLLSPERGDYKEQDDMDKTLIPDSKAVRQRALSNFSNDMTHEDDPILACSYGQKTVSNDLSQPNEPPRNLSYDRLNYNWSPLPTRKDFQSQLESSQFSPILHRNESFESCQSQAQSLCMNSVSMNNSSYVTTSMSPPIASMPIDSYGNKDGEGDFGSELDSSTLNLSTSVTYSSSNSSCTKSRKLRPMPDMAAFDGNISGMSRFSAGENDRIKSSSSSSPIKVVCPPTPERTPAWAINETLTPSLHCLDSLTSNKILVAFSSSQTHNNFLRNGDLNKTKDYDFGLLCGLSRKGGDETQLFRPIDTKEAISLDKDFENLGPLGSGAFADVSKVRSKATGRLFAIKRNRRQFRSKRDRERALAEVKTMQRLQAPVSGENVVKKGHCPYLLKFVRAWQDEGHFFSQTELCCRDNCRHMMESLRTQWPSAKKKYPSLLRNLSNFPGSSNVHGRMVPESSVWKICHDVVVGLAHIHAHGMVHHDIKPSNIFFVAHDQLGCICKIGDFGMAGDIGSAEDGQEGDTMYMPQELLSSGVKQPSADIFSLGLTLYELAAECTWELPTEGPRWHEIRNGKHRPVLHPSRSQELLNVIQGMISLQLNNRPAAGKLLKEIPEIKKAGCSQDKFLGDYVKDINQYDMMREQQLADAEKAARDRRCTPTGAILSSHGNINYDRSMHVRTPTPESISGCGPGRSFER